MHIYIYLYSGIIEVQTPGFLPLSSNEKKKNATKIYQAASARHKGRMGGATGCSADALDVLYPGHGKKAKKL